MDITRAVIISTGFTFKVEANRLLHTYTENTICSLNLDNSLILCKPVGKCIEYIYPILQYRNT